jgi:TfoX/Sxy family transcriptional regulator of competence genes
MAFDKALAARVREVLARKEGTTERKMFGGLAFLLNGNMCCGVTGDRLMLRLGEGGAAEALAEPHTHPMDFTGKPMKSMIYVDPAGLQSDKGVRSWVQRAVEYVSSLPAKA